MTFSVQELLENYIRDRHPAVRAAVLPSLAGHEASLAVGRLDDRDFVAREVAPRGVIVESEGTGGNVVVIDRRGNASVQGLRIRAQSTDGLIYLGPKCSVQGLIRMHSPGAAAFILGENAQPSYFNITLWSRGNTVLIGPRTTSNGTQLVAMGENASIIVGEDCMFSTGVWLKTSDMHCIVDIETGEMINKMGNVGDILIGKHAWIGQDALVVLGVEIGDGAIIGAKSFVNKPVAKFSLNVGSPVRELRTGVTWLRSHTMVPSEYEAVRRNLGL